MRASGLRLAALAAVSIATAGCGAVGMHTATIGQNDWATGSAGPRPPAAIVARARATAARSRLVLHLTGVEATVSEAFVWLGSRRRPRVVELAYALPVPRRIDAVVPFAEIPPDAPATGDCRLPYAPGWELLRARGVRVVFVGVDVVLRKIADISTDAKREVVSSVPGRPFPVCNERQ